MSHFCWCISFCLFWSSFSLLSLFTATAAAACWLFVCCSLRKFWRSVPSLGTGWFRTPVPVFDSSSSSSSSPPENWYSTYHYYYQKSLQKTLKLWPIQYWSYYLSKSQFQRQENFSLENESWCNFRTIKVFIGIESNRSWTFLKSVPIFWLKALFHEYY